MSVPTEKVGRLSWSMLLLYALVMGAATLPIVLTTYPPLIDYPTHLAQIYILSRGAEDVNISKMFDVKFTLVPNLVFYFAGKFAAQFMSVQVFGKAFLVVTMIMTVTGVSFINSWVNDRLTVWALPAAALWYSSILHWGFLNFLFAIALSLWTIGFWLRWRDKHGLLRLGLLIVLTALIYLSHGFAFGLFILTVAAFEVSAIWRAPHGQRLPLILRRTWQAAILIALPLVLFVLGPLADRLLTVGPVAGGSAQTAPEVNLDQAGDMAEAIVDQVGLWERAFARLTQLLNVPLESVYFPNPTLGAVILGFFFIVLAFLLGSRRLSIPFDFWLPIGINLVAFALISDLLGAGHLNIRGFYVALLLVCAGIRTAEPRDSYLAKGGIALVISLMMAGTVAAWKVSDKRYEELAEALSAIERGSTLRVIFPYVGGSKTASDPPYRHFASYATISRQSFVAEIWARGDQQFISRRPDYETLAKAKTPVFPHGYGVIDQKYLDGIRACAAVRGWDYLLFFRWPGLDIATLQPRWREQAQLIADGQDFWLFALDQDQECTES